MPGYNRTTDYSLQEFNDILAPQFYKWSTLVDRDFTKSLSYDRNNPLTFNYKNHTAPDGRETPGYWKGVYLWMLDTDKPNTAPWEMLGFNDEPTWWVSVYGPAPYTRDNLPLWQDLSEGIVREPGKPITKRSKFVRPFLIDHIPVDGQGNILSPLESGLSRGTITNTTAADFVFGDVSPVESAWRRSSYFPFGVLITALLMQPNKTIGTLLDRSRIVRNAAGQLVYKDTGLRITPDSVKIPSIYSSETNVQTAGIINYIVDYILSDNLKSYSRYQYDLKNLTTNLSYRVAGFTSKEKFKLLLDSKTPLSQGSVFVPPEDYNIILNSSSPIKKITYSGVIITKLTDGFSVKGYSKTSPYFKMYPWIQTGAKINVGGISEGYSVWTPNVQYVAGKIVEVNGKYYRVKALHTTKNAFEPKYYESLPELPIIGGREAFLRKAWNRRTVEVIPYGFKFKTVQEVVDFLLGYGEWLKDQGFIFDEFNSTLGAVTNWETSAKEFLFWTTQNWSTGEDKWQEWLPQQQVSFGSIVRYNGDYYRAIKTIEPTDIFDENDYVKLDGLSTVGSSVISLSPAAAKLTFSTPLSVVDDIRNSFNDYEIFKVDGNTIAPNFLNSFRKDNAVSYTPQAEDGIYGASFYLVQKEQVVVLKNSTMFNDTIYHPASGYRQQRIKVSGYINTEWNGSFNVPGFVFDQAKIDNWDSWTDYALGAIVKYKEFYYSAKSFLPGVEKFNPNDWVKLEEKPTARMIPNWSYKASQFTDFYSLDSDNFDAGQQSVAQHLIGYQKRQYLSNIIKDDVSEYKFYQGMIIEKGTQNVLNKLFDVLSADNQESLKFNEEWAIRTGQYGASSAFENVEFILDESLFKNNPQGFELVDRKDNSKVDFIIRQDSSEIYLKPIGYTSNIWPAQTIVNPYLRTPGYARQDEVTFVLPTLDAILSEDISKMSDGGYVWVGFENREWNVYRYTDANLKIENVTYVGSTLTVTTKDLVTLKPGQYIGISQVENFSGFYKIEAVDLRTFTVSAELTNPPGSPFTEQDQMLVFVFVPQRAKNSYDEHGNVVDYAIDRAAEYLPSTLKIGELLWTDDDSTGKWATWKYNPVYSKSELVNDSPAIDEKFGKTIAVSSKSNITAIATALGYVEVYDSAGVSTPWIHRQTILPAFVTTSTNWNSSVSYTSGDVVFYNNSYYNALQSVPTNINPSNTENSAYWNLLYSNSDIGAAVALSTDGTWLAIGTPAAGYVTSVNVAGVYNKVDPTGNQSSLKKQGVISLYVKDLNNIYSLVDTILSPVPSANEEFGGTLTFGNNILFVGATGHNNKTGKVYALQYATKVEVTKSFNPTGSSGTVVALTDTIGISAGMSIVGTGFKNNQTVVRVIDETSIEVSSAPSVTPVGQLSFTTTKWRYTDDSFNGVTPGAMFGASIAVDKTNSILAIAAPGYPSTETSATLPGEVFVYKNFSDGYAQYGQSLVSPETELNDRLYFGNSISVTDDGQYIALSSTLVDRSAINQGTVFIYKNTGIGFDQYQELSNSNPEQAENFGTKLMFAPESNTLVVYSRNADSLVFDTFDRYSSLLQNSEELYGTQYVNDPTSELSDKETSFDLNLTTIATRYKDGGRIDIYDQYGSKWIFSESLPSNSPQSDGYGQSIAVSNNTIFVSAPNAYDQNRRSGKIYRYRKTTGEYSWKIVHTESTKIDSSKIKQAFLYNKKTNKLVTYLDVIDPAQGKIPGLAAQELKYKTYYDPATYSVGNSVVNVDDGMAWTKSQIGMLWWDLRTAKFYDSYDDDVVYRNSTWNTLFPGASIDVYEWVESTLKPSQWDAIADTEVGLAKGISGTSLYGDSAYSTVQKYDNVAKVFKNTYYYWVKNKTTIPNIPSRHMSARDVAALIENPRGQGYKYLALTGINTFSLVNVKSLLENKDVVLSVEYWTVENANQNIHTQWKLISTDENTKIPAAIEQKWFDSLCGKDQYDRLVPDLTLPIKLRYGIENRPRQGMFVNRIEALKQIIERVNRVLKTRVVEDTALSNLQAYDAEPTLVSGLYDAVLDTNAELRFANVGTFKPPVLIPVINDGKIIGVEIISAGFGYVTAPTITVTGKGENAKLKAVINAKGQIVDVQIVNSGVGYNADTTFISVRSYSVLVHSDSDASGSWSIYSYDSVNDVWSRVRSQAYDTRKYWNYIDWYATGFNQFSSPDFSVDTFADLNSIIVDINELVKVRTTGTGNWVLLKKYSSTQSIDWTQQYEVVGIQNGTIQFTSGLYDFIDSTYGYDGSLYDGSTFDNSAATELRIILTTIRDNIFVDDLRTEYLELFFNSIRYVLSEQTYVDWVFKTSFVKAQHNVGELKQKVTYNNDNLEDFESYVSEVKPYRTKIREYVSSYSKVDNSSSAVTDFDLLPVYSGNKVVPITTAVVDGEIFADNNAITQYPWKFWYDNLGFKVTELRIVDGGSGYRSEPVVRIEGQTGTGATARAFIANGRVNRIVLLTQGSGYLSAPKVVIDGGLRADGTPARVVAIIGDGVVRSTLVKVKFDRLTQSYYINNLNVTETFVGTGSKVQFPLIWGPNILIGQSTVTVNNIPALRDSYKLAVVKTSAKGYTSYSGSIVFDNAPAKDSTIVVNYNKDWSLLNAADRIQHYYNPASGEIGKDLSQLMTGIDYGGVIVNGIGFEVGSGWDSVPYYSDKWGSLDESFDNVVKTVDAGEHALRLPYVPEAGEQLNIYHVTTYSKTYVSDGVEKHYTFDMAAEFPPTIKISKNETPSGIVVTGVEVIRDTYGNMTSTLKVDSTTGIAVGMELVGIGFESKQKVKVIVDETTLTLTGEPNILPDGVIYFTINSSGSDILTLGSTEGIEVGDIVEITPYVQGTIGYNTSVVEVVSDTQVKLDKIMFQAIPDNSTVTFTRELTNAIDYRLTQTGDLFLKDPVYVGSEIKILSTYSPIRLDDPEYGTVNQQNVNAVMSTVVGDGQNFGPEDPAGAVTYPIIIPDVVTVSQGDVFIVRKITSDGSAAIQEDDYDTAINGGDLAYNSATGLRAEDIIIDGDDFVTPTTSPAPEEVVPGQVVDSVAIKIFETPKSGSANIAVDNFRADGEKTSFVLSQYPNSPQAIIVKVAEGSMDDTIAPGSTVSTIKTVTTDPTNLDADCLFDFRTKTITFRTPPADNEIVSVFNIGISGANVLDVDYFVSDGSTTEFVTRAPWTDTLTYLLYVDGVLATEKTPVLFRTDLTYDSVDKVGIRFSIPPEAGALINYIITDNADQTFAVTTTETILPNGSDTYNLQYAIGNALPIEASMIVRVDQEILKGPSNVNFKILGSKYNYPIEQSKIPPYTLSITDINVIAGGDLLRVGIDYTVDMSGITIKLNKLIAKKYSGKTLTVSIRQEMGYLYVPASNGLSAKIIFASPIESGKIVEVIGSYKHDILDIQRTNVNLTTSAVLVPDTLEYYNFIGINGGHVVLERPVVNDNFVWVIKNNMLLTHSIDYKLNNDKQSLTLAADPATTDEFTVITFSNNVIGNSMAYMQFKDMLNRVHFKRLSRKKQTKLAKALKYTDMVIEVVDASNFDPPNPNLNRPGIIEVCGERIEFFSLTPKETNGITTYVLGQLRRGTLGTGVSTFYEEGTYVQEIGVSETIPYIDTTITETIVSDGTNIVPLNFVPSKGSISDPSGILQWFTDQGYIFKGVYNETTAYVEDTIVSYNGFYYRTIKGCKGVLPTDVNYWKTESSIPVGYGQSDDIEVFANGTRLKKKPHSMYSPEVYPDSPEGDVQFDAEFSVNGVDKHVRLTTPVGFGTHVTVVKKTGSDWGGKLNNAGLDINSAAGQFIKAEAGITYNEYRKTALKQTFDNVATTLDSTKTTFDQG